MKLDDVIQFRINSRDKENLKVYAQQHHHLGLSDFIKLCISTQFLVDTNQICLEDTLKKVLKSEQ